MFFWRLLLPLWRSLLVFDACFWCYLSWPEVLLDFIAFLRCLILLVFVVAGQSWGDHCFSSMLDLDAICRGRRYFWKSLLAFDAWFWWYMWCSRALGYFIVCLRCLISMLFVVAGSTFGFYCLHSMLDLDGEPLIEYQSVFWMPSSSGTLWSSWFSVKEVHH